MFFKHEKFGQALEYLGREPQRFCDVYAAYSVDLFSGKYAVVDARVDFESFRKKVIGFVHELVDIQHDDSRVFVNKQLAKFPDLYIREGKFYHRGDELCRVFHGEYTGLIDVRDYTFSMQMLCYGHRIGNIFVPMTNVIV